jgi:hypothetical protein
MAGQIRQLKIQRDRGNTKLPDEEKLEKMLFGSVYKDR